MDNNQKRIFEWLNEQDECLCELYEAAVRMVEDDSFPGRKRLICHAVREIRNRLPEKVGAEGIRKRVDYTKEVGELAMLWENEGVQSIYQKDSGNYEPVAEYRVSGTFLKQVEQLVQGHMGVGGRKKHNAKQLLMALETENKKWEGTLGPVVKQWLDVTEWFVSRVHVGRAIDDEKLMMHFESFEGVLLSLIEYFYEGMDKIKEIVESANLSDAVPNEGEVAKVVALLGRSNYRIYFFKELKNPHWLEPLKNQGFFRIPDDPEKGEAYDRWLEEWYLCAISERVPEKVLGVIRDVKCENPYVRSGCIKCLLKMPLETAAKGNGIINNLLKREFTKGDVDWLWVGQNCAKLMVKMVDKFPDSAFVIAWALLDAWVSEEKTYGKDIVAKFSGHYYRELMLEHYNKVWEAKPEQTVRVLIRILKQCLEDLDTEENGYDASISFGFGLALGDLDKIDMKHPGIKTILVKGICEAGIVLIDKEPGKVSGLLGLLEETNRIIFLRIAMYLLRFVPAGTEKKRISKFVGNKEYFKEYNPCWNEHRRLLNDKFDAVSAKDKKAFLGWVEEDKFTEERRKDIADWNSENKKPSPNFEKMESFAKAEELYLVRERFEDEYKRYKKEAGVENDSELAPRKMVSEARCVSPMEGTPLIAEDMAKMTCEEVLDYILEPKNYEGEKKVGGWGTVKDALTATFGADVRKRPAEYLKFDLKTLELLAPEFLAKFFYAVSETVREGSFKKEGWERLIDLACGIVGTKNKEKEWKECFLAILWVLHDGFGEESNRITFNEAISRKFWFILKELVGYNYDEKSESEEEPIQRRLRSVQGGAFGQVILLGIECKNDFATVFENFLKKELVQVFTLAAKEIKRSEVNCTLGYRFASIYWLDKEWVESNAEIIFDDEMWDAVWGTYVSWGRPSPQCFKYLVEKGMYGRAVERIGAKSKYKFGKKPDDGLVEHLMIGYFNGWIVYEDEVLQKFFEKSPAGLRAKAARFLATGFKDVNEGGGDEKERLAESVMLQSELDIS